VRARRDRLSGEPEWARRQVAAESIPLTVWEDAAQVQYELGTVSSPTHAGTVEPEAREVSDGALDDAGPNVEIVAAQLGIAHAMLVVGEMIDDLEHALPAALVT
jgi:hypothetical protein